MSAVRKLAEPTLLDPREALATAIDGVRHAEEAIEANQIEQAKARASIMDAEREVDEARKVVASVPALQKRAARVELERLEAVVEDLRAHLAELRSKHDALTSALDAARHGIIQARGAVLNASASVQKLFSDYKAALAFVEDWRETGKALASAGALPFDRAKSWDASPSVLQRVSPDWRAAIDALTHDANAPLPE